MDDASFTDHPFVRTLSAAQVEQLRPCARAVDYPANSFIFREGDPADTLFLLSSGCVALEQHIPGRGATTLESLCAGDILGLSWLMPQSPWTLDARCIDAVSGFALAADCVQRCMQADAALGRELATHLVAALYHRLVRVRLQRLDVYNAKAGP